MDSNPEHEGSATLSGQASGPRLIDNGPDFPPTRRLLTSEQNKCAIMNAVTTWELLPNPQDSVEDDIPSATHSGEMMIGAIKLKCFRLSNGMEVIDADSFEQFFGLRK